MKKKLISIKLNGQQREVVVDPTETLIEILRDRFGLMAAKNACGEGRCGACTVFLNGVTVNSCMVLAIETDQCEIVTVEGLAGKGKLHPLQEAFIKEGAIQCGYCTPGMIISAEALLKRVHSPNDDEIRQGLSGNFCRCTGYDQIMNAVKAAAKSNASKDR